MGTGQTHPAFLMGRRAAYNGSKQPIQNRASDLQQHYVLAGRAKLGSLLLRRPKVGC